MTAEQLALKDKIKTALDESRTLILGVQVLLGFQFHAAFQEGFERLPELARGMEAVAALLMVIAMALLVTPSAYHRMAVDGADTGQFHRLIGRFVAAALLPFALGLGIDLAIAVDRIMGLAVALAAGVAAAAIALGAWFGLGKAARQRRGGMQRAIAQQQQDRTEHPPLHARIEQMLTEARVILPGVQALLGFQLVVVLTQGFERLPDAARYLHAAALGCMALSMVLLIAPGAYHRIVYEGEDSHYFLHLGGALVAAATVPLAFGVAADLAVLFWKIFGSPAIGAAAGLTGLALLLGLWIAFPALARARREGRGGLHLRFRT